ncbi:MAG: hypothetical protein R2705_05400 [Ilumatobacteraceae bacterium]
MLGDPRGQRRDRLRQLRRQRLAPLVEHGQHIGSDGVEPGARPFDAVLLQQGHEPLAVRRGDLREARLVDHTGQVGREDEHGPPHAHHPDERSRLVLGVGERVLGEPVDASPRRQDHGRRIRGVERDEIVHDVEELGGASPRREVVARCDRSSSLLDVHPFHRDMLPPLR